MTKELVVNWPPGFYLTLFGLLLGVGLTLAAIRVVDLWWQDRRRSRKL
jgi:hypothetical protein